MRHPNHLWSASLAAAIIGMVVAAEATVGLVMAFRPSQSSTGSVGSVTFSVDDRPKRFDVLTEAENHYTRLASTIRATPAAGVREHLRITFLSIDLRTLKYPVELPLARSAVPSTNPLAAMATVGFSYGDEAGQEWAGPGRIRIDAYSRDGVITGTFTAVSLPHTTKMLPPVRLASGAFRARIGSAW